MKPKLRLSLALILCGGLFGCAGNKAVKSGAPQPATTQGELAWPVVAAGQWEFTPELVVERFKGASVNALGSNDDIVEINQSIAADNPRRKLRVTNLRWLSPTLAMAKVRAMEAEFVYVIEKKEGRWKVVAHYTQWGS